MEEDGRAAIEARADALLAAVPGWIWSGHTPPVPIEEIVDSCLGLLVRDVEDLSAAPGCPRLAAGQSLSGLLLPSASEIWVDAEESRRWPARRRFTIAHEVGHWALHQDQRKRGPLFCRHGQVDPAERESAELPPLDPIEEEANQFAAALLIPAALLRREYERPDRDFSRLCAAFSSSGAAMGRRLHQVI